MLVCSPAILNMLGIIRSRPWLDEKVVREGARLQRAMYRAGGTAFRLHLAHNRSHAPNVLLLDADQRRMTLPSPTRA